ncbi:hypothetical protein OG616_31460 [Streptomyces antibioticus]|uniref:hypothetical protein n=1 Tax=Streptomyces antibioticus TaxID=1890 RepID=UPI00224D64F1|nr:hypothetical protein [Streptomyces antibioticus]MCX5172525.1 hypothetical protein [Streptomyces antibioticus]
MLDHCRRQKALGRRRGAKAVSKDDTAGILTVGNGPKVRGDGLHCDKTLQITARPRPDVPHGPSAQSSVQPVPAAQNLAHGELLHDRFLR